MATSPNLAALIGAKLNKSYDTMQLMRINAHYEAVHKKLEDMERYETKWEDAYDKAIDNDRELKVCCNGRTIVVEAGNTDESLADKYAHAKVKKYDAELLEELAEEDMEYESLKTVLETAITEEDAQIESLKQITSASAQETHLLGQ